MRRNFFSPIWQQAHRQQMRIEKSLEADSGRIPMCGVRGRARRGATAVVRGRGRSGSGPWRPGTRHDRARVRVRRDFMRILKRLQPDTLPATATLRTKLVVRKRSRNDRAAPRVRGPQRSERCGGATAPCHT